MLHSLIYLWYSGCSLALYHFICHFVPLICCSVLFKHMMMHLLSFSYSLRGAISEPSKYLLCFLPGRSRLWVFLGISAARWQAWSSWNTRPAPSGPPSCWWSRLVARWRATSSGERRRSPRRHHTRAVWPPVNGTRVLLLRLSPSSFELSGPVSVHSQVKPGAFGFIYIIWVWMIQQIIEREWTKERRQTTGSRKCVIARPCWSAFTNVKVNQTKIGCKANITSFTHMHFDGLFGCPQSFFLFLFIPYLSVDFRLSSHSWMFQTF